MNQSMVVGREILSNFIKICTCYAIGNNENIMKLDKTPCVEFTDANENII